MGYAAISLILVFLSVFTNGIVLRIGVNPIAAKLVIEVTVIALLISGSISSAQKRPSGFLCLIMYLTSAVASALLASESLYDVFLYSRYVVYAYMIYFVIWNTPLTSNEVNKINLAIITLFLTQVLASMHEVFVLHGRWEAIVGTVSADGGSIATTLPLFAIAYVFSIYLWYRRSILIWPILLSFTFVSYASHKRATWFVLGPFMLGIYALFALQKKQIFSSKTIVAFSLVSLLTMGVAFWGMQNTKTLNFDGTKTVSEQFQRAFEYAKSYDNDEVAGGTTGRTSSANRLLESVATTPMTNVLLGWGPRSVMGTAGGFERLGIVYGISGWMRDVISIGWPAMIAFVLIYQKLGRQLFAMNDKLAIPYWRAILLGTQSCYLLFAYDYFYYGTSFVNTGALSFTLAYFTALLLSPLHLHLRQCDPSSHSRSQTMMASKLLINNTNSRCLQQRY